MVKLALLFFLPRICFAAEKPPLNVKVDFEVHDVSRKFAEPQYPKEKFDAWWLGASAKKDWENTPHHYRHLHAMIAAGLFDRRSDRQTEARAWLDTYECENVLACREGASYLEGALKVKEVPVSKSSRKYFEALRQKFRKREKKLKGELPPRTGVCAPGADRARWLALEYELFCPPYPIEASGSDCGMLTESAVECSDTAALKFRLERDSYQMVLSSSFLGNLKHHGSRDCSKPWEVELECGGMREIHYRVKCEQIGERAGRKIRCVGSGDKNST